MPAMNGQVKQRVRRANAVSYRRVGGTGVGGEWEAVEGTAHRRVWKAFQTYKCGVAGWFRKPGVVFGGRWRSEEGNRVVGCYGGSPRFRRAGGGPKAGVGARSRESMASLVSNLCSGTNVYGVGRKGGSQEGEVCGVEMSCPCIAYVN